MWKGPSSAVSPRHAIGLIAGNRALSRTAVLSRSEWGGIVTGREIADERPGSRTTGLLTIRRPDAASVLFMNRIGTRCIAASRHRAVIGSWKASVPTA